MFFSSAWLRFSLWGLLITTFWVVATPARAQVESAPPPALRPPFHATAGDKGGGKKGGGPTRPKPKPGPRDGGDDD